MASQKEAVTGKEDDTDGGPIQDGSGPFRDNTQRYRKQEHGGFVWARPSLRSYLSSPKTLTCVCV